MDSNNNNKNKINTSKFIFKIRKYSKVNNKIRLKII